jgi:hypothetical protein
MCIVDELCDCILYKSHYVYICIYIWERTISYKIHFFNLNSCVFVQYIYIVMCIARLSPFSLHMLRVFFDVATRWGEVECSPQCPMCGAPRVLCRSVDEDLATEAFKMV